jgi:LAO/AO transport system kinase
VVFSADASGEGVTGEPALRDGVLAGDTRAVARALTLVENRGAEAERLLAALGPSTGRAWIIGVTGPPGAGKSTFTSALVGRYRARGHRVAVLAVDPSSPFSGGAVLGDRVRMQAHTLDEGVFVRSVATRGHLGGLPATASDAVDVFDAAGFDIVLVETVGVGQDEVEIVRLADTCVVLTVPGTGDDVQAMKAGVMEIADLFVVNKADLDGAGRAAAAIVQQLELGGSTTRPHVLQAVATTGVGIDEVISALDALGDEADRIAARRRLRAAHRLESAVIENALAAAHASGTPGQWDRLVEDVAARRADPREVARRLSRGGAAAAIDHVGLATNDLRATLALLEGLLSLPVGEPEVVPAQGVRVRFAGQGDTRLEIIEAIDPLSPFSRSLARRGPGLHHLALRVADLPAALARLEAAGVELVDREPRPGAHGSRVAFLHPASTCGVLIELVEHPENGRGKGA